MKNIKRWMFLVAFSIMALNSAYAQTTQDRTITVYGSVAKISTDATYKTDITLTLDNGYYTDNPCKTIEELKANYFEELKKLKIDPTKFKVDDLAYVATGYRKEGTVLHFETKNKEDILKVTGIKMAQVMPSYVQVKYSVDDAEVAKLTKDALKNARKNADVLAEAAGEEVDKVHSISSYDYGSEAYWTSLNTNTEYFRLTVVYKLKD